MVMVLGRVGRGAKYGHSLYSLNTTSTEWVAIHINSNTFPHPRCLLSMFCFENKLFVFAGYNEDNDTTLNDFYEFSVKIRCWSELSEKCEDFVFTPRR